MTQEISIDRTQLPIGFVFVDKRRNKRGGEYRVVIANNSYDGFLAGDGPFASDGSFKHYTEGFAHHHFDLTRSNDVDVTSYKQFVERLRTGEFALMSESEFERCFSNPEQWQALKVEAPEPIRTCPELEGIVSEAA